MGVKRKPIEERTSFIGEISPKNNLVSRVMTAITTGQIAGSLFGAYVPWLIVGFDGFARKKPTSIKNFMDYAIFKTSATLMNPSEIENILNFVKEKYKLFEPYVENLINYF
jgi:hypothetical protein